MILYFGQIRDEIKMQIFQLVKNQTTLAKNIYMISNKQTFFNKHKVKSQAELAWNLHK